ncbi:MAG: class I SAM-dependent methyltransferase [Polyangiaceae bacterium]
MQSSLDIRPDTESAQDGFTQIYGKGAPPWDTGRPQPPYVAVADRVLGPVLDAGCGTGSTSLFFAGRGLSVTGIDFVEQAIVRGRARAVERGLSVDFLVKDAMTLVDWDRRFRSVIDSGLFHIYHGADQARYVAGLTHVTEPGGRLFLFSFSSEEPGPEGGFSEDDVRTAFAGGWDLESAEITRGELNPAFVADHPAHYPAPGPKMLFAILRRRG